MPPGLDGTRGTTSLAVLHHEVPICTEISAEASLPSAIAAHLVLPRFLPPSRICRPPSRMRDLFVGEPCDRDILEEHDAIGRGRGRSHGLLEGIAIRRIPALGGEVCGGISGGSDPPLADAPSDLQMTANMPMQTAMDAGLVIERPALHMISC